MNLATQLHHREHQFGGVVLLMCAIASKYTDDPRVLANNTNNPLSAGWKYYSQVPMIRRDLFYAPNLHDLQLYCLAALYAFTTSSPHLAFQLVGIGLRFAQDVGVHRRKPRALMTADDEMRKRAFWVLFYLDATICSFLGRAPMMYEEFYDADLPIECDDEYWVITPTGVQFNQPRDKPSTITAFNRQIPLATALCTALRSLYGKVKPPPNTTNDEYLQQLVTKLDSSLNEWSNDLPEHLRWDPLLPYSLFSNQSAVMHAMFYSVQIQVHRPLTQKSLPSSFHAVAICANAARSLISIIERQATAYHILPTSFPLVLLSSGILLLNLWTARRSGMSVSSTRELTYLQKCGTVMEMFEDRWYVAGRAKDTVYELSSMEDPPLPSTAEQQVPNALATYRSWNTPQPPPLHTNALGYSLDAELQALIAQSNSVDDTEMLDIWSGAPVGFSFEDLGTHMTDASSWNVILPPPGVS